jgi:hypothetical protein
LNYSAAARQLRAFTRFTSVGAATERLPRLFARRIRTAA